MLAYLFFTFAAVSTKSVPRVGPPRPDRTRANVDSRLSRSLFDKEVVPIWYGSGDLCLNDRNLDLCCTDNQETIIMWFGEGWAGIKDGRQYECFKCDQPCVHCNSTGCNENSEIGCMANYFQGSGIDNHYSSSYYWSSSWQPADFETGDCDWQQDSSSTNYNSYYSNDYYSDLDDYSDGSNYSSWDYYSWDYNNYNFYKFNSSESTEMSKTTYINDFILTIVIGTCFIVIFSMCFCCFWCIIRQLENLANQNRNNQTVSVSYP